MKTLTLQMITCPICHTPTPDKRDGTPYYVCPTCDLWHQHPLPPKLYAGAHEPDPEAMGDDERRVNRDLAKHLFEHVMGGKPGSALDVGAKYPVLAAELQRLGCTASGMDGDRRITKYASKLRVGCWVADFETVQLLETDRFDLITFVHVFEHLYDPLAALRKLRSMIAADGAVFIRMPDHRVPGYERDLTPGHFSIHPVFHTLSSVLQALAETKTFVVTEQRALQPGQRDLVIRPI